MEGRCVLSLVGKDSGTSGGVGAFPIPFIKYFQYFLSRVKCAHNFNDPYRSTFDTMSKMLCNRSLFWEWITPPTRRLFLHCSVISFVVSCLSELRVTLPMKLSLCLATWFLIFGISNNI